MAMDDKNELQPNGLWPPPKILAPLSDWTVSPGGFNIVAIGPAIADSWKIECWGEATDHHGSENELMKLEHWVPDTSFDRFGAYFSFKVRYKMAWIWSDWAECRNLYVPVVRPPKPLITKPLENSSHLFAPQIFGNCVAWAKVDVKNVDGSHLAGAYVNGEEWAFNYSGGIGRHQVRVQQTVKGVPSDLSEIRTFYIKPSKPTINDPVNPVAAKQELNVINVSVNATGLQLFTDTNAPVSGSFTSQGIIRTFTPTGTWAAGKTKVKVVQIVNNAASDPSDLVTIEVMPPKPLITKPLENSSHLVAPQLSGNCMVGAKVAAKNVDGSHLADVFVNGEEWALNYPWGVGKHQVRVIQAIDGVPSDLSDIRTFYIPPSKPTITAPVNPVSVNQPLTITGVLVGATSLQMTTHLNEIVKGDFSPSGTTRTFTPTAFWAAGTTQVKVVQTVGNVTSEPSDLVSVKVKPAQPTITAPVNPVSVNQTLTITGVLVDAISLQMTTHLNATVEGGFSPSGTTRIFTPKAFWPAGTTQVKVVQNVGGVASDPSNLVIVQVKPTKPTITAPVNPVSLKEPLIITGVLAEATSLQMSTHSNAIVEGSFSPSATTFIFTPKVNWTVGNTLVKVVQAIGDVISDPSNLVTVSVKPPKPTIAAPITPASVKEQLTITDVLVDATALQMTNELNEVVDGGFSGSGTIRTFTPKENWPMGKSQVKVLQTVGGVNSDPSDLVTLVVKVGVPAINRPPDPAAPKQALVITGVVSGTATLQILTNKNVPVDGDFTEEGDGICSFIPLGYWAMGFTYVKAVQTVNEVPSDPSSLAMITVRPATPAILRPSNPVKGRQALILANVSFAELRVSTETNVPVYGSYNYSSGTPTFTPANAWAPGITKVKAVVVSNGTASAPSNLVSVVVQPSPLVIEQPTLPAAPEQQLKITGVEPNVDTLQMSTETGAAVAGEYTGSGELRTFIPKVNWAPGKTRVKVVQTVNDVASDPSNLVTVAVKPPKLTITAPVDPASIKEPLTITGVLDDATDLQMTTKSEALVDGSFSPSGTTRTFTPKMNWSTGITQVKVVQLVDDVPSDPSELVTIRVAAKPPKPQITQPLPNTSHLANVTVEGTCELGAEVLVQGADGSPLAGEVSYDQMKWFFKSPWLPGQQKIKAVQSLDGLTSDPTDVLDFYIRPSQPVIEQPHTPVAVRGELKISNVSSGIVALRMSTQMDIRVDGEFAGDGATRTFTPNEDWSSGENKVKVVQTVNNVDSDPSDLCTFTVESVDKPEPPKILKPQRGARTSRYPTIKVAGLPGALHTVRLEESDTLHQETANADGILEFMLVSPLEPGDVALQVMQASDGADSDWSVAHPFMVKEQPQTPTITVPRQGENASRKPQIRGTGQTGGLIVLHHESEPDTPFASPSGSTGWRWTANEEWPVDTYTVRARQTADGDCSEWTEPRTFNVIDSRYAIGDASPVLGTPVVGTGQSVLLRVQVISGVSGEAAVGVEVEWRINGETEILATTKTDPEGWTFYRYTPATVGTSDVLADITNENAAVVMTELYQVTAVPHDDWAKEAELNLDGERVDLAVSDLMLLRRSLPYKLELKVKDDSALIGSTITLEDLWGAVERGLTFVPDLGTPQTIGQGASTHWYISTEEGNGGFFGLNLTNTVLPDWQLPGHLDAGDLAEAVLVDLDSFPQVFGGDPAFPCLGATHTVTVRPRDRSCLFGRDVLLELSAEAVDLGVTASPSTPQTLGADGVSWSLNCASGTGSGSFAVWLKVPEWNFSSLALPMFLSHNKVKITEQFGPQEMGGTASYWRYGIRATSTFTGEPAVGVPVTVAVTGKPTRESLTAHDGWVYINYYDGESASLTIRNRYDGSSG